MQALGGTGVLVATGVGASGDVLSTLEEDDGTVGALGFFSPASQLAADDENDPHSEITLERGEDDDIVLVWTEAEAGNFETTPEDEFDEQETIIYDDPEDPEGVEIPLISQDPDQPVVAIGTTEFVEDGRGGFRFDNEEFLLNLFDEKITSHNETATVGYDEGHGQFLTAEDFSIFASYVADHGYEIEGSDTLFDDVAALEFPSTASQVSSDGDALTDESVIAVWAEETAENVDDDGDEASHIYGDDEDIPLVARDGTVLGFGTPELIEDGDGITDDNVQFLLNVLDDTIGDSGTLLWDDAHDTFYDSSGFTQFRDAIESEGYEFAVAEDDIGGGDDGEESVADPATPGSESVHSWLLTDVAYGEAGNDGDEVDTITVSYPDSASFDGLNQDDITVVMTRTLSGGEDTSEISVNQGDYSGSEATFNLSGQAQTDVAGPIEIEIDGIENPDEAGEFDVDITLDGDAGELTVTETLVLEENGNGDDSTLEPVSELEFFSTTTFVDTDGEALTDESAVAVWAEETAYTNGDEYRNDGDDAGEGPDIPLVAVDGSVVGIGSDFASDASDFDENRDFLANAFEETLPEGATILYDESHGQSLELSDYGDLESEAESRGFSFDAVTDEFESAIDGEDALMIVGADDGEGGADIDAFTQDELDAVETFVNEGGAVFVLGTSEFEGDSTDELNDVLSAVDAEFRFASDQVEDPENSGFAPFVVQTSNFNEETFDFFGDDTETPGPVPVDELEFFSTASLVNADGEALTDDAAVAVWAEETAYTNGDEYRDDDDDAGEGPDIPLVAVDGSVVGIGSDFASDASDFGENRAFLANAFEETLPEEATILYDESHGQSLGLGDYGDLESEAEDRGFSFDAVTDEFESAIDGEDAVMIVGGDDGDGGSDIDEFSQDELDALETFVDEGGAVFLLGTSDFEGDSTDELNDVLSAVDAEFRFASDQVEDPDNSGFAPFVPQTANFNDETYPDFFGEDEDENGDISIDADAVAIPSPSTAYTQAELDALETHVGDGGAVLLFDESEFVNEETTNLNEIADSLDVAFRFNADQVEDAVNNGGPAFVPRTTRFNEDEFPALFEFAETDGLTVAETDALMITSPSAAYTQDELSELSSYVADGGAVFIFDESDFGGVDSDIGGFDETENLNEIASALDLPFRFNSDQVNDLTNNAGPVNEILTANYDADRDDLGSVFDSRGDGLGIDFEKDETYFAKVVRVFDGDTFEVEFLGENGFRETIRHLGMDTAETGDATNETEEWFGIGDDELDHLNTWGSEATEFSLDLMARGGDDPDASAGETNIDGRIVSLEFDEGEPLRGNFGRLLAYMYYDEDEYQPDEFPGARDADPADFDEGDFDRDYNLQTVEEGYARVYSSGFGRHDEYAAEEEQALADGEGVWSASDFDSLTEIRNHSVSDVFVPKPSSVTTADGSLDENVIVRADESATQEPLNDADVDEYDEPPLAAFDPDNRIAVFGGILMHEIYEEGEGDDVTDDLDLTTVGNFPLFTNVIQLLTENDGPFIIEGGHGQFNTPGSVSLERVQFYLRYLEGLSPQVDDDVRLRQINSLDETLLEEDVPPRAVFLTAPDREYTEAELDALRTFRDDGGAVVLVGSQDAPEDPRAELNRIAEELGSDLRLNDDAVVDEENAVAGNSRLILTDNFDDDAPGELFLPTDLTREIEPPEVTATLDTVESEAWILTDSDAGVGRLGEDGLADAYNPTLTLEVGTRHRIENDGWDVHPLAFENSEGETLLSQDDEGSFDDDGDVVWVDDGDAVEFTVTEALAAELSEYRCTVHGEMTGDVETTAELGPPQLDIAFDGPPQSTRDDGLFDDVTGSGDDEPDIADVQALFDMLGTEKLQDNAEAFSFSGVDSDRVTVFDVQGLFSRLDS